VIKTEKVSTEQIGRWYRLEFEKLDKSIPLQERYDMATDKVFQRIEDYKRMVPLDNFF